MNFTDLYKTITTLDSVKITESDMEECGGMMSIGGAPKQPDNVSMNVSLNGSGAGGIRDLMNILRDLEGGEEGGEIIVTTPNVGHDHGHEEPIMGDEGMEEVYSNDPNPTTAGIDAVTATGNDLASKGAEAYKVNGGGNPMPVSEELINRLSELYKEVKLR